jgi:hypothetical protein
MKTLILLLLLVACGKDPVKKTIIYETPLANSYVGNAEIEEISYPVCKRTDPCRSGCNRIYSECRSNCNIGAGRIACEDSCEDSYYSCLGQACTNMCRARDDIIGEKQTECILYCKDSL